MSEFRIKDGILDEYCGCSSEVCIPDGVKEIGLHAFCCCMALRKVIVPYSVEEIGAFSFQGCMHLDEVVLLNDKTYFHPMAFEGSACYVRMKKIFIEREERYLYKQLDKQEGRCRHCKHELKWRKRCEECGSAAPVTSYRDYDWISQIE